jgi:hypothetical protein
MIMAHHATIMFDTLRYAKKLQKAGFTEVQAEAQVEIIKEQVDAISGLIDDSLATKKDIKELDVKIETKIKELDLKIEAIKNEIIIKLGGVVVGTGGLMLLLMKLFRM